MFLNEAVRERSINEPTEGGERKRSVMVCYFLSLLLFLLFLLFLLLLFFLLLVVTCEAMYGINTDGTPAQSEGRRGKRGGRVRGEGKEI